ncbi:ECF transporter S component [Corynebacterium sp. UMB6689]|uniref:ECF transporter S component n=1 Tax=Corynebacterium sp. UMB6689 TaxID=3046341 RepID=UPI00254D1D9F|nr:ECF transporter S component [Corynebacterium sp. UMB6689]MDK6814471.1 ECF transporter S component [Corynebacterium sp. UMB6689]
MTQPNKKIHDSTSSSRATAESSKAWTGIDALVVMGFSLMGALLLWGKAAIFQRVAEGEDMPLSWENLMVLLSALWVLQFMGALCAALTTRKPGAAFVGYVMTVILCRALVGSFDQLGWPTIIATGLVTEAAFFAFKYTRFTILSGALAGAAAVLVTGIATFVTRDLAPGDAAIQFRAEVIQFLVTIVTVAPVSYLLAIAVRSAFYKTS